MADTIPYSHVTDPTCSTLWFDFVNYQFSQPDVVVIPPPLYGLDAVDYILCPLHCQYHVQIDWRFLSRRSQLKVLNHIFPFSSASDKTHTILDLASFLINIHTPKSRLLVNEVLTYCTVGLPNILVMSLLIHGVGNSHFPIMLALWKRYELHVYRMVPNSQLLMWPNSHI